MFLIVMNRTILVSMLAISACGSQAEEELITDAELDAIVSSREGLAAAQPEVEAPPGAAYVRLAWGYLAGRRNAPEWVNWSGEARVEGGGVKLENLTYFDWHDRPVPVQAADRVGWSSRTLPHFDGLVLEVTPAAPGQKLRVVTPRYQREHDVEALAAGINERSTVDGDEHEFSISSIPAGPCGGFSYGYERASLEGWLGFAGLFTNARGEIVGRLRFKADEERIAARLYKKSGDRPYDLSVDGEPFATGRGRLDSGTNTFEFTLHAGDGATVATVSGHFAPPSYSRRGSYQAVVRCQ